MRASWLTRSNFFGLLLLLGLLAMTERNAVDPDLWWHLRTGQWIVETGSIPHTDPFSFTRAGSLWVSHEWLSEVVFYEILKFTGFAGLVIFSALVTTIGFSFLYLRCPGRTPGAGAAALVLGAVAASPAWGVRPQMFTFALASTVLWLLDRGWERPRLLLWIPPLFILWVNLHAGFMFGPALMLAFGAGLLWEVASSTTSWVDVRPQLGRLGLLCLACVALIPLNPSGAQLYRYPLDVVRSTGMRSFINEWFPPDFHQVPYLPVFMVWMALLWSLARSRGGTKGRVLAPLILTILAALDAVRHIPLLVLTATPVIAAGIAGFSPTEKVRAARRQTSDRVRLAFRAAVLILLAGFAVTRWSQLVHRQARIEAEQFPAAAMEFLRSQRLPGRLFVYYDWGGYAIWKLYPEYRVFIDGRADLYGDDMLHQFQKTAQLKTGWRQVLDQASVELVLAPTAGALAQGLLLDAQWQAKYRDSRAILFARVAHRTERASFPRNLPE